MHSLTITGVRPSGIVASTEPLPPSRALELGERAVVRGEPVTFADGPVGLHFVAVPLERQHQPYGAVCVAVRMDALQRVRRQSQMAALAFAAVTILALALGLDLLARRFVHRPLAAILGTMACVASAGDFAARAPRVRSDELGAVARRPQRDARPRGQLQRDAATRGRARDGRAAGRNRVLPEAAQRLFAARRELARSERLALAGGMAAAVAHQVGTPLNVISGHVQLLRA